jgi:hypothetical protein
MYLNITKNKDTSPNNLCTGLTMAVRSGVQNYGYRFQMSALRHQSAKASPANVYSGVFSGLICGKSSTSWMLG